LLVLKYVAIALFVLVLFTK